MKQLASSSLSLHHTLSFGPCSIPLSLSLPSDRLLTPQVIVCQSHCLPLSACLWHGARGSDDSWRPKLARFSSLNAVLSHLYCMLCSLICFLIGIASFSSAISPILLDTRACKHSCTCPHDSRKFTGAYTHTQIHRNQMCQGKQHSCHFQLQVSLPTQPPPLATPLVIKSICSHCSLFLSYFAFTRLITHTHTHTH